MNMQQARSLLEVIPGKCCGNPWDTFRNSFEGGAALTLQDTDSLKSHPVHIEMGPK